MTQSVRYPSTCVAAFIIDGAGRVLLGERVQNLVPCLPGGKVDWGESVQAGVAREVLEETGLVVEPVKLVGFTDDLWPEDDQHFVTLYFRCKIVGGALEVVEPTKINNFRWVAQNEIPPLYARCEKLLPNL